MSNFYICWKPGLSSYDQHGNFQLFVAPAFSSRLNWHLDIWTCKQNIRAHKNKSWKLKIQLYLFSLNFSRNNTKKRKKWIPVILFCWNERIFTLAAIIAPGTHEIMKYVRLKNPQLFCFGLGLFVCLFVLAKDILIKSCSETSSGSVGKCLFTLNKALTKHQRSNSLLD